MACDSGQAGDKKTGVPQIEVTPEMIEAGVKAYWDSWGHHAEDSDLRQVVRTIFVQMSVAQAAGRASA